MFYRAVVREILLYAVDMWVLSAAMERKAEGTHTGFLRQIMGKRERRLGDGTWETPGKQLAMTYIGIRQATVAQLVELHPLFEVC